MVKIPREEASKFIQKVDAIFGFYLDTTSAFQEFLKSMIVLQKNLSKETNLPISKLDERKFKYENNKGEVQFFCKQKEIKKRIKKDGENYKKAANLCIVSIYQYWEYYRRKGAKKLGVKMDEIKYDIMGDLRYIRNSILKHEGIGNKEISKCKILTRFEQGKEINISSKQFEEIIKIIKKTFNNRTYAFG